MTKQLEELEALLILDEDAALENLQETAKEITKLAVLDKNGYVRIKKKSLGVREKIQLILAARFIAHSIQKKLNRDNPIDMNISYEDLHKMVGGAIKTMHNRLGELVEEKKAVKTARSAVKIMPHEIEKIIRSIGEKNE